MNVTTVITISLKTTAETFESEEFQELLDTINSGKMKHDFEEKDNKVKVKAACSYWTNYKKQKKS
jgi:hypothetical protein